MEHYGTQPEIVILQANRYLRIQPSQPRSIGVVDYTHENMGSTSRPGFARVTLGMFAGCWEVSDKYISLRLKHDLSFLRSDVARTWHPTHCAPTVRMWNRVMYDKVAIVGFPVGQCDFLNLRLIQQILYSS